MASIENNTLIVNDLVSLPIIISDWDLISTNKKSAQESAAGRASRENRMSTSSTASSVASQQDWTTGFGKYVDNLWDHMTDSMRRKLREACVEVLRRTDDASEEVAFCQFDDDARMLDRGSRETF